MLNDNTIDISVCTPKKERLSDEERLAILDKKLKNIVAEKQVVQNKIITEKKKLTEKRKEISARLKEKKNKKDTHIKCKIAGELFKQLGIPHYGMVATQEEAEKRIKDFCTNCFKTDVIKPMTYRVPKYAIDAELAVAKNSKE